MYNILFGKNKKSDFLLNILGLTEADCGRFRDCYLKDDIIVIYTRNGGGNREQYQEVIDELSKHPNYLNDYDDNYDSTYCYIEFSIPDRHISDCKGLKQEKHTPGEKFKMLINDISKPRDEERANELEKMEHDLWVNLDKSDPKHLEAIGRMVVETLLETLPSKKTEARYIIVCGSTEEK
jgi:hypothetical protein